MQLLIASGNKHKLEEMRQLLGGFEFDVIGPSDLGLSIDVAETGVTYGDNALLKAKAYAEASNLPVLSDDSGLEVDALDGAPGIYSARFGGSALTDADRVQLLLTRLRETPVEKRTARFRCSLALIAQDGTVSGASGCCEGSIAASPRGSHGFGYDPVFILAGSDQSMSELSAAEKNRVSHRAIAITNLGPSLAKLVTLSERRT